MIYGADDMVAQDGVKIMNILQSPLSVYQSQEQQCFDYVWPKPLDFCEVNLSPSLFWLDALTTEYYCKSLRVDPTFSGCNVQLH